MSIESKTEFHRVSDPRQQLEMFRREGVCVNELIKGFSPQPTDNTFVTMVNLANSIQETPYLADKFAIDFATWYHNLRPAERMSVWSKDGSDRGMFEMDAEQLLDRYKKEKGITR
jgi:hypothetical protein